MRNYFLPFLISLIFSSAIAQTGTISGTVTDYKTGEAIIGANVMIQGTAVGAPTDLDGNFVIPGIKPGTYNLAISFITYRTHIVPDVEVEANKKTTISIALQEELQELDEVIVMGAREINNDFALLKAIKESKLVVTGISAEQISKSQDRDAAQVMRRVPGVTVQENRFIVVRGLSSRYSSVVLNGVFAPSSETDSRAFSFDVLPSGLIDQILVYKTGAAWLPGDFAGAVVQITTKNVVDEPFINSALSMGYRRNTTMTSRMSQERSSTEWLGFDGGARSLPKNAPSNYGALGFNPNLIEIESRKWNNTWGLEEINVLPDFRFNLNFGKSFSLGRAKLSTINGVTYSNANQYNDASFNRYYNYEDDFSSEEFFTYKDDQLSNNVRLGLLSNWALVINNRNKIEFRNLFNNIGTNETIIRNGDNSFRQQNYRNYSYRYIGRSTYMGQLEGKHELSPNKLNLTWLTGYTTINREEPDWRRLTTARLQGSAEDVPFVVNVNSSVSAVNSARFYQDLNESSLTNRIDLDYSFNAPEGRDPFQLKAGYWLELKDRSFQTRTIAHVARDGFNQDIASQPYDRIFDPANVAYNGGHFIDERQRPQDSYTAENLLAAGYVSLDMPFSDKIRVVAGLRTEYNRQQLQSAPGVGATSVDNTIVSVLPFLNASYNLTPSALLRLAYSKTVNRPEFRELAEFSYYDFQYAIDIVGNQTLKISDIHNVDFRWEYYPTPSEFIAIGGFGKYFLNPIETVIRTGTDNPALLYTNAKEAYTAGAEVEVRKALAYTSSSRFLNHSFLVFNASLIYNRIQVSDLADDLELQKRPMQGQSPYIVNLGYYYEDIEKGLQANLQYNVFGKRITFVGNTQFPTWWEIPRHLVDLNIAKTIGKNLELRLGISDLLNAKWELREDPDLNNNVSDVSTNKVIRGTRNGQLFTVGLGFKF
jgi:TonB-dependent receptor